MATAYYHHKEGLLPSEHMPAINRGLLYGDGFFSTMRVSGGRILFRDRHWDRMLRTASFLGFGLPMASGAWSDHVATLCPGPADYRCRVTVFRAGGGRYFPESEEADALVETEPLKGTGFQWLEPQAGGVCKSPRLEPTEESRYKLLSRVAQVRAARVVQAKGLRDGILCNTAGRPVELLSSNLFIVRGNRLVTPPLEEGALDGVVRRVVLERPDATEAPLSLNELEKAEEVFATNSVLGIRPVYLREPPSPARTGEVFRWLVQRAG